MKADWSSQWKRLLARRSRSTGAGDAEVLRADRKPFVPNGHFYSPVVNVAEVEQDQDRIWPSASDQPLPVGIDFNREGHEAYLSGPFSRLIGPYDYPDVVPSRGNGVVFHERNAMFCKLDSRVLFVMLRWLRPKRVVEIGCGFSSLLTADVNQRFLDRSIEFTCIEP